MNKKQFSVRHAIPGRIRFKVGKLKADLTAVPVVKERVMELAGVMVVRANPKCASLVVNYDPDMVTEPAVTEAVRKASLLEGNGNVLGVDSPSCACADPMDPALIRFGSISAVMGAVFVRTTLLGLPVAEAMFSPLGLIAMFFALPLFRTTLRNIRERKFTLEMFLGASIVAAVAAGEALTAFEVLWINSGAELLKAWITERSRRAISDILKVTTHHTFILVDGVEVEAKVEDLRIGDVVVLHTGEKVCVDGEIVDGEALLDESPITGRSEFSHRKAKDRVYAGTFVREGVIYVRADEVGDKTYLSRILMLVEDSLENKAAIEGVADQLAANLVKVGFACTIGTLLLTGSLWRAFTVLLVMACPCATVLSASTAISAAISAAAKRNILIKGGRYLEEVGKTDTVCFDKTGTLTSSEPELLRIIGLEGQSEHEVLRLAGSVETHNHHPLAQAVMAEARKQDITPIPHSVCEYYLGMGMRAELDAGEVIVGNRKLMDKFKVKVGAASRKMSELKRKGLTALYVVREKEVVGLLGFANQPRPQAEQVVGLLIQNGIRNTALVTGDEKNTAFDLADKLGIRDCHSSILPEEKATIVATMQDNGQKVLMVGDGINDALALARADVGVAMGAGGSEVAIEAADIALVKDDLDGLAYVHSLSQATIKTVHQNFWIATGSNIVGVVLGAAGYLTPVMAGLLHIFHSLGVLANSSRLLAYEPPRLPNRDKSEEPKEKKA